MVSLKDVQLSNARISSALPPHLICVFVGATSGIGEYSLKTFAKYANKPRIYFVGRSQESADRISSELKALNSEGEYYFIKADVSLIHNVDKVCQDIKDKEKSINLLFLCPGAMHMHQTSEGLNFALSLAYYARMRFVENFLPLMQDASSLRRVVNVLAGTKEGNVNTSNWGALSRGHLTSITTLTLEMIAKKAPEVSFIHNYPGAVKTNLIRGGEGVLLWTVALVFKVLAPFVTISNDECGERHTFLATSARFPPVLNGEVNSIVPLEGGVTTARGTDGKVGSGIYSIDSVGESANLKTETLLAKLRRDKVQEAVWKHVQEEFSRIMGK